MQSALRFSVDERFIKKRKRKKKNNQQRIIILMEFEKVLENVFYLAVDMQQDASGFKYSA